MAAAAIAGIAGIIFEVLGALRPGIEDMVRRGIGGEDITHHWVMEHIPPELQTVIQDKIKTEARRAAGLPV